MQKFFTILFLLFSIKSFSIGVVSGTSVKTLHGMVPVECLQIGDEIVGCDFKNMFSVPAKITNIAKKNETEFCLIKIDSDILIVPQDQRFFDPNMKCWVKTKNLTQENFLIDANFVSHKCLDMQSIILEPQMVYELSVTSPHTLFISEKEILVHNALPVLFTTGAVASGISATVVSNIIAVSSAICLFCEALFLKKNNKRSVALPGSEFSDDWLNDTDMTTNVIFNGTNQIEVDGTIFIKPESMSWEKVLKNFNISSDVQNIVHKKSKHKKNKKNKSKNKHKNKKKSKCKKKKNNNSGGGDSDPDQDDKTLDANKKRIINTISEVDFFKKSIIKKCYRYFAKVGERKYYQRIKGTKGLHKKAEFICWDSLHNDLEVYNKAKDHLGSIDPMTLKFYKDPIVGRTFRV